MLVFLQVISVFFVAVTMALALAHALELPGKLRLDKATYLAVQAIYYPGFTFGGVAEGLAIIATLILVVMTPPGTIEFRWTLVALIALVAMHATYWIVTHPVNKFWLKDQELGGAGARFFALAPLQRSVPGDEREEMWLRARDRWEHSHVLRAVLGAIALISLTSAVAL